jgi:uncharacterized membrane protein
MTSKSAAALSRRRRRLTTVSWIAIATILTSALIYWEKTAILYILATVGLTALLAAVALADLHGREQISQDNSPSD